MKIKIYLLCLLFTSLALSSNSQNKNHSFKVIAFYTAKEDQAHISFVHEANLWFPIAAKEHNFTYDSTNNWDNLNEAFLSKYQVVLFLDTRPEKPEQRQTFEKYMKNGGAWMGFHFAGFALTPSDFNQDWDWYHYDFIGAGQYKGNTWHPSSAVLHVEDKKHPSTKSLPELFTTAPNEWYSWEKDIRNNPDIDILLSIDSTSFPLGNGPKMHEIWHSGYYPVAWTNKKYKMIYANMGHNDIDYDHGTNKELSSQFSSEIENRFFIDAILWLGGSK